jgi:hypothetical protein
MSLLPTPEAAAEADGQAPAPEPTGAPPPQPPGGEGAHAQEPGLKAQPGQPPAPAIPAKFLRPDGTPDVDALAKSYAELERYSLGKEEALRAKLEQERLARRPEKADAYAVPETLGIPPDELAQHPLTQWWREHAYQQGLDQAGFETGIRQYLQATQPNLEEERAKLGENAEVRTRALGAWVYANFSEPQELAAIERLCSTAAGVQAMERLMQAGSGLRDTRLAVALPSPEEQQAEIERLMQSDAYWNPNNRDPQVVKRVEQWFEKQAARNGHARR